MSNATSNTLGQSNKGPVITIAKSIPPWLPIAAAGVALVAFIIWQIRK